MTRKQRRFNKALVSASLIALFPVVSLLSKEYPLLKGTTSFPFYLAGRVFFIVSMLGILISALLRVNLSGSTYRKCFWVLTYFHIVHGQFFRPNYWLGIFEMLPFFPFLIPFKRTYFNPVVIVFTIAATLNFIYNSKHFIAQGQIQGELVPDILLGIVIMCLASLWFNAQLDKNEKENKRNIENLINSEKMAQLGNTAAGVAHEVQNPITIILNSLEQLNDVEQLGIAGKNIVQTIGKAATRISRVVESLRTYSRAQGKTMVPVVVGQVLEETYDLMNAMTIQHNIALYFQPNDKLKQYRILADKTGLQQALVHLITNSVDSILSAKDERLGVIEMKSHINSEENSIEIVIADNGIGIPKEIQAKIYDPFFTTKPAGKGAGLGLSIVLTAVKSFGGRIDMRTHVGEGTTFTLVLPVSHALELDQV